MVCALVLEHRVYPALLTCMNVLALVLRVSRPRQVDPAAPVAMIAYLLLSGVALGALR